MKKPLFHKSLEFAIKGMISLLRNERNFQIEVFGFIINLFLIVFLKLTTVETCLILFSCFLVLIAETINTCIEEICDYIQPKFDLRIGFIKDISAGAVLLSVVAAICIGVFIYKKYFIYYFF